MAWCVFGCFAYETVWWKKCSVISGSRNTCSSDRPLITMAYLPSSAGRNGISIALQTDRHDDIAVLMLVRAVWWLVAVWSLTWFGVC